MDDRKYAKTVFKIARKAQEKTETKQAAIDLMSDAIALLLSEYQVPNDVAIDRIMESRPVFDDAEIMATQTTPMLS